MNHTAPSVDVSRRIALLLFVVIAAAYSNSLSIGFYFDDWHVLEQNPHIRSLTNIPRFFVDPNATSVLRENKELRPLLMISFAVNYAISGNRTWSYHVVNLVLHWLVALLIVRIVRDHLWLGDAAVTVAVAAALVVAAHPLNTEPLNYISARSALLTTVFYLAAFDAGVRRRRVACLALFAAALLTKAIAMTLPFMLIGYWWLAREQSPERARGLLPWWFVGALVGLDVAGVLYRILLLPPWVYETAHQPGMTPWVYFMTEWSAYLYYLRLFLWPNALVIDRVDYPIVHSIVEPQAWAAGLGIAVLVAGAWLVRRRWPALTFAAFWYFVALAVESTFFPLAEPVNEHRPYLAMLGLGTVAGFGLWQLASWGARRYRAPAVWSFALLMAAVTSVLAAATYGRNQTWQDDYMLWGDAIEKAPNNARAWLNAGHAAMGRNEDLRARQLLMRARELSPCYAYIQTNLSALEAKAGAYEASLDWADEAVRCNPRFALSHEYRAVALERLNRWDEALDEYRQTTAIDNQHAGAWFAQGRLLERRGRWAPAAAAFDAALAADPSNFEAAMRAGLVYHHLLADPARAIERYQTALRLLPTHYGAHYQIATALLAAGREAEALGAWKEFVTLAETLGDRASIEGAPEALRMLGR